VVAIGLAMAFANLRRPIIALALLAVDLLVAGSLWNDFRVRTPNPFVPVPSLSSDQAKGVFDRLLQNVYRSFDYRDDAQVYDALSRSLAGPILERTYLDIKKGLVVMEQGGAQAQVTRVSLTGGKPSPLTRGKDPRGFDFLATWEVEGTVEHWGHIHQRTNEYQAIFSVEPIDDAWKITSMNVQSDKRKSFKTRVRSFQ
jgi:hypothetical protein